MFSFNGDGETEATATPVAEEKKPGAFSRWFAQASAAPTDGAGRFNVLSPFHFLTKAGAQEGDVADTQRQATQEAANNALTQQKQIAAHARAHGDTFAAGMIHALNIARAAGTEADKGEYDFGQRKAADAGFTADNEGKNPDRVSMDITKQRTQAEADQQSFEASARTMDAKKALEAGHYILPQNQEAATSAQGPALHREQMAQQREEEAMRINSQLAMHKAALANGNFTALSSILSNPLVDTDLKNFAKQIWYKMAGDQGFKPSAAPVDQNAEVAKGIHSEITAPKRVAPITSPVKAQPTATQAQPVGFESLIQGLSKQAREQVNMQRTPTGYGGFMDSKEEFQHMLEALQGGKFTEMSKEQREQTKAVILDLLRRSK